jgi:hypothetical protein
MTKPNKGEKINPKDNWKVGNKLRFVFDGFCKICKVVSINGYNTLTGELHLTLMDKKGNMYNSAYDKNRYKL